MDKKWESWIPLLSTFLGGFLAILGGTFASGYQASITHEIEHERLVREKVDKAYLLLLQAEDWGLSQLQVSAAAGSAARKEVADTTREALMLVRLYAPELKREATQLEMAHRDFKAKALHYWRLPESRRPEGQDLALLAANDPRPKVSAEFQAMNSASATFGEALEQTLRGLEEVAQELH